MNPMTARQQVSLGLILAALMAVTRGQHVALATHLPDASLAVFFLAGVYLRPVWVFPALFGLAALIDTVAVTWGGVGAFCITGAYAALIPAYGALWAVGRWYAGRHRQAWSSLIPLTGATLPLIAQGGSSLLAKTMLFAILIGLSARRTEVK